MSTAGAPALSRDLFDSIDMTNERIKNLAVESESVEKQYASIRFNVM